MIIGILGPTAVGKTALSLAVAKHFNTDIINADSVQIYRRLDIGSAKPPLQARQDITHHMIDIVEPEASFSVALYQKKARSIIEKLQKENKLPLLVGGTGYYIKSVLHDYRFGGIEGKRERIEHYRDTDNDTLHARLAKKDPLSAQKIHPNNRKRVLQALHRAETGQPPSTLDGDEKRVYDYVLIGLSAERSVIKERVTKRVDTMFHDGLIAEVKGLYDAGIRAPSIESIGYRELYAHFDGEISLTHAKELIIRNTMRYVKKQATFFRKMNIEWHAADYENFEQTCATVIRSIEAKLEG